MIAEPPSVVIERIEPLIDGGKYPIKRAAGEELTVEADIFKDGHDIVSAVLKWRPERGDAWRETPMFPLGQDRWRGVFTATDPGVYEYTISAWGDVFRSWVEEVCKKVDGGLSGLLSEALEGSRFVEQAATRADSADAARLREFASQIAIADTKPLRDLATDSELGGLMHAYADRSLETDFEPYLKLRVDRERAAFAAWYEFFPRSAEGKPDSGSTFRDCLPRVEDAKAMGFDVIYFPPIHPIGESNRKGRNNAVTCEPGDPGVPYAIGNFRQGVNGGGHKDVAPELGTLEDFDWLVREINARGMEVALDFAINCSPDHPYVKEHPEWFFKRPDGTIKYAENPPKKYQDVYPLNFHNPNWETLWHELRDVLIFWCEHGVRTFRVDNPHTKPVSFWAWVIAQVHARFPDVVFLSEAFTVPRMMQVLAKVGYTQSYTYFTWRNSKWEIEQYMTELTRSEMKDYFRANFFANTPDILPYFLQHSGRPGFIIRAVLAATLTPVYGIYSGFELCENAAVSGKEEYLDSEKYQFKGRDWNAPGNIKEIITRLNAARRENRALSEYRNLTFHRSENESILVYSKMTAARDNIIVVAVNLDPHHLQTGHVEIPVETFGYREGDAYEVEDLLSGERFLWTGARNFVALEPRSRPAHVLRVRRHLGRRHGANVYA